MHVAWNYEAKQTNPYLVVLGPPGSAGFVLLVAS